MKACKPLVAVILCLVLVFCTTACASEGSDTAPHYKTLKHMLGKTWQEAATKLGYSEAAMTEGTESYRDYYVLCPERVNYLGLEWYLLLNLAGPLADTPDQIISFQYVRHYEGDDLDTQTKLAAEDAFSIREALRNQHGNTEAVNGIATPFEQMELDEFLDQFPEPSPTAYLDMWALHDAMMLDLQILSDIRSKVVVRLIYYLAE